MPDAAGDQAIPLRGPVIIFFLPGVEQHSTPRSPRRYASSKRSSCATSILSVYMRRPRLLICMLAGSTTSFRTPCPSNCFLSRSTLMSPNALFHDLARFGGPPETEVGCVRAGDYGTLNSNHPCRATTPLRAPARRRRPVEPPPALSHWHAPIALLSVSVPATGRVFSNIGGRQCASGRGQSTCRAAGGIMLSN
jgi:hypothetical protein